VKGPEGREKQEASLPAVDPGLDDVIVSLQIGFNKWCQVTEQQNQANTAILGGRSAKTSIFNSVCIYIYTERHIRYPPQRYPGSTSR